ncbi:MAG: TIGR01777 family oxidoreductase [Gemmatimonadales bacterium]|jgi:uncharacterized protein (TIGR01777 family)
MRVFLTGATGFVGTPLVNALCHRGNKCTVVSKSGRDPWNSPKVTVIRTDPSETGYWQDEIERCDAVINLSGARIVDPTKRWTNERRLLLRSSRIDVTRNLATAIRELDPGPSSFLSASAIGFYGSRGDDVLDESARAGDDFLAQLSVDWEQAAVQAGSKVAVALLRNGMVLGTQGGVLGPLLPLFKTGLGGPWGDGSQWWSWIHLDDAVGIILFALETGLSGPINVTAPKPVTVNEFAEALGTGLRRPSIFRAPKFMLRAALGKSSEALLTSQRVVPKKVLNAGYNFRFPSLYDALDDLLSN